MIEFDAGKYKGEKLSELDLPEGAYLVALLRDEEVQIPRKNIKLNEEDQLLILVEDEDTRQEVKELLSE